ncbi:uncharacterized protein G2W53_012206 [Senna tora]|uniref:Uncharacterized protein n=1 Tax=Senna tora TaxID=362788 RepID=A0A834TWG7_9FABA|nr:uncharacterized protein G2W53_012206 [Senna tora]
MERDNKEYSTYKQQPKEHVI